MKKILINPSCKLENFSKNIFFIILYFIYKIRSEKISNKSDDHEQNYTERGTRG